MIDDFKSFLDANFWNIKYAYTFVLSESDSPLGIDYDTAKRFFLKTFKT